MNKVNLDELIKLDSYKLQIELLKIDVSLQIDYELELRQLKARQFDRAIDISFREPLDEIEASSRVEGIMYGMDLVDVPQSSKYYGKIRINY